MVTQLQCVHSIMDLVKMNNCSSQPPQQPVCVAWCSSISSFCGRVHALYTMTLLRRLMAKAGLSVNSCAKQSYRQDQRSRLCSCMRSAF